VAHLSSAPPGGSKARSDSRPGQGTALETLGLVSTVETIFMLRFPSGERFFFLLRERFHIQVLPSRSESTAWPRPLARPAFPTSHTKRQKLLMDHFLIDDQPAQRTCRPIQISRQGG
jgi:hypothetical protein